MCIVRLEKECRLTLKRGNEILTNHHDVRATCLKIAYQLSRFTESSTHPKDHLDLRLTRKDEAITLVEC
jgi:hypothetical protein